MLAPPLPSRDHHDGVIDEVVDQAVDQALGNLKGLSIGIPNAGATLENDESLLSVLNKRQLETYAMAVMNESSDIFAVKSLSNETIKHKIDESVADEARNSEQYWKQALLQDAPENPFGRVNQDGQLMKQLVAGLPEAIRGIVYLKLFNVRYQLTKDRYQNLLKKSQLAEINSKPEVIKDHKIRDAVFVFNYYITEVLSSNINKLDIINNNTGNDSEIISSNITELSVQLIKRFGQVLDCIESTTDHLQLEEIFYIFLKLNKLISNWNLSELIYEINRALEDFIPQSFVHISKQGIQVSQLIKQEIHDFFPHLPAKVLIKILDMIVFYGFAVFCQVFVYLFQQNSDKINSLDGDQLAEFLFSQEFYQAIDGDKLFESITEIEPCIIKYENEYYLIYMNSLNNNNNELINAKEINEELNKTITQLTSEIDNLSSTHDEILSQQATFEQDISKNQMINDELTEKHSQLQAKFNQLTMKDNLTNTIKANKEFSDGNAELQAQIDQLKESVRVKQEKLTKYEQVKSE